MEINEIIQKYIQVILTWPFVFIVLGFMYRESIREIIKRITEGEWGSFRVKVSPPAEQQKDIKGVPKTEDEIEQYVKDHPKEMLIEYKKLVNSYWFERIFNIVYGTQIAVLEHLSEKKSDGEAYINLAPYYNEFITRSKLFTVQMADYLGFLKSMNLIEYQGEGNNLTVKITPYGLDFLSYIKGQYQLSYKYRAF